MKRLVAAMLPFPTPQALVEGLHARQPTARRQLQQLLQAPVDRLMGELIQTYQLKADRELLVQNALHLAEVMLRVRPLSHVANLSWEAFRAGLLINLAKLAIEPAGNVSRNGMFPPALPDCPVYYSETFFRPHGQLGGFAVGGDWYAGRRLNDGSLCIFLADVTGHGYFAYLLAIALPSVWQRLWAAHPGTAPEPAELLTTMHELLADCLPDGIFLECTLVRLTTDGQVTVAPAGGTRLLLHPAHQPVGLLKLRGAWVGLRPVTREEQHQLDLKPGDELVLATDGVFDQLDDAGGAEAIASRVINRRGALFQAIREAIESSLQNGEQKDDMTMVLLRRRAPEDATILPFPTVRGGGNV